MKAKLTVVPKVETYEDRLERLVKAMLNNLHDRSETRKLKTEVAAFMQEQARMIVQMDAELQAVYA